MLALYLAIYLSWSLSCDLQWVDSQTSQAASFEGVWKTGYGLLELEVEGTAVTGTYPAGSVRGTITGNEMHFVYDELDGGGDGRFVLSPDGTAFEGKWRAWGDSKWRRWNGSRESVVTPWFDGLFKTSYGPLRLTQRKDTVIGRYLYQQREGRLVGKVSDDRYQFQYEEGDERGTGWLELSDDRQTLSGKCRRDGGDWVDWSGVRQESEPGQLWLVILEADWETGMAEPEYAFADMLEQYFRMASARHVSVRKRSFHDRTDLVRCCRELKYLPGPVVLVISSHGSRAGVSVGRQTIGPKSLARGLAGTPNLHLLHLSGCALMGGDFASRVQLAMGESPPVISGYAKSVAWDASAISDFLYLSLVLIHRQEPMEAAKEAIVAAPFLGEDTDSTTFRPLKLTVAIPALATSDQDSPKADTAGEPSQQAQDQTSGTND